MKFKIQIFQTVKVQLVIIKLPQVKNVILTHVSFIENYARLLLDC
jgi:hypothetical protein